MLPWRKCGPAIKDRQGLAAIEFALIGGFLSLAILNITDISVFCIDKIQLNNAAQMGAQAAYAACDLNHIPATVKCPNLNSAVSAAINATSLGSAVSLQSGYPSEGYYCVNTTGALQRVSDVSSEPNNCSAAGNSATVPADYIEIQTSYAFTPIFSGPSVVALLPATLTATSWTRLGG